MVESIRVNGLIIIWKVWVFTPGLMVEDMRVNTSMIKSMALVSTCGQTAGATLANGSMGSVDFADRPCSEIDL